MVRETAFIGRLSLLDKFGGIADALEEFVVLRRCRFGKVRLSTARF